MVSGARVSRTPPPPFTALSLHTGRRRVFEHTGLATGCGGDPPGTVLRADARLPASQRAGGRGGRVPGPERLRAGAVPAVRHVRRPVRRRGRRERRVRARNARPVAVQHRPRYHGRVPAAGDRVVGRRRRQSRVPDRRARQRAVHVRAAHVVHVHGRRASVGRGESTAVEPPATGWPSGGTVFVFSIFGQTTLV